MKKTVAAVRELDENGEIQVKTDHRPPMFQYPQEWDIAEELQCNEAVRDFQREKIDDYL